MTCKIMALTDALGNLLDFRLLPGQAHDLRGTAALIDGLKCGQLLADRAFDADWLRTALIDAGIKHLDELSFAADEFGNPNGLEYLTVQGGFGIVLTAPGEEPQPTIPMKNGEFSEEESDIAPSYEESGFLTRCEVELSETLWVSLDWSFGDKWRALPSYMTAIENASRKLSNARR